jgi:hypothetical protein
MTDGQGLLISLLICNIVSIFRFKFNIYIVYVIERYYVGIHTCYKIYTEFNQPGYSSLLMLLRGTTEC